MPDNKPAPQSATQSPRKRLTVVPVGDSYAGMEDDGFRWMVGVDSLGGLKHGAVIGAHQLQPGANIKRLVDNGYLVEMDREQAKAHEAEHGPAEVPPYPTANLQPPKPEVAPQQAHTFAEDARKADEAKARADADAAARAKHDAEEKARADAAKAAEKK